MKIFQKIVLPQTHPFLINKYTNWYYSIIYQCTDRVLVHEYTEKHHIIPDCFYVNNRSKGKNPGWIEGNSNSKHNIVKLTAKEHFICHWLLTKMTLDISYRRMRYALQSFTRDKFNRRILSAGQYDKIKKEQAIASSNLHLGKILSIETKLKMSISKKGIPKSEETKAAMRKPKSKYERKVTKNSIGIISVIYKPKSEEHKRKLSEATSRSMTIERKELIRKQRLGSKLSDEAKLKMSIASKGKKKSAEHAANISKGSKGKKKTPEHIKSIQESKKRHRDLKLNS